MLKKRYTEKRLLTQQQQQQHVQPQKITPPRNIPKVPPIKTQGIKTKLVPFIMENIPNLTRGRWIEPFLGSGVVMFNASPQRAIGTDSNIHIIKLYKKIQSGKITHLKVREFLTAEGKNLSTKGEPYYYDIRDRFNEHHDSLDFLFLNRSAFNGLMRFNSKRKFNVPFCKKTERFSKSYITKITNQVMWLEQLFEKNPSWEFNSMDWKSAIDDITDDDFLYLDPPYYGRSVNYYDMWNEQDMDDLAQFLKNTNCMFALSLWYENTYRKNMDIERYFSEFTIKKHEHFYHIGSTESLRNSMTEALIMNL